jgi:hypothetical protein
MSDPNESKPEASSTAGERPMIVRRRLLQGGLGAAPVMMTLVSRPVMAQQCITPSAFCSGNTSNTGPGVICTGHTPEHWISIGGSESHWPRGFPPHRPFNSFFHSPPYPPFGPPQSTPPKSLLDVLNLHANPPVDDVARLIVAALLNAAAGLTPVLTTQLVKQIWEEYFTTGFGYFSPTAGARWYHDDIIIYLRSTLA